MPRELVLICGACDGRIYGNDGYLWVDTEEVAEAGLRWREYRERQERRRSTSEPTDLLDLISSGSDPVQWQAHHAACDPRRDQPHYRIEAARLHTRADLREWSAHLVSK